MRDVLSRSPEQVEYAEMLKRRAAGDPYVCRAFAEDTELDDNIIGFHAQQVPPAGQQPFSETEP